MNNINPSAPNTELLKTIKHLMVDKGIGTGYRIRLLDRISDRLGKPIHRNTLYNALSGYRSRKTEQEVLAAMKSILEEMPDK